MLKLILFIIVMMTSIPAGMLLTYLTKEELKELRRGFYALIAICLILISGLVIFYKKVEITLALTYMAIVSFVCLIKSRKEGK